MTTNSISLIEKENKRKSLRISALLHGALVLLLLLPLMAMEEKPELEPERFIEIVFNDFNASSAKSSEGDKKEKEEAEKKVESTTPEKVEEEVKPEPVVEEPKPEVKPEPTPAPKPVLTTPENNPPVVTSPPAKVEPKQKPTPKPDRTPSTPAKVEPRPKPSTPAKPGKESGKPSDSQQEGTDKPTNSGGGEAPENGQNSNSGKTDSGTSVGEIPGDGLFNRKVVFRADVKSVTSEEGKIVIDLCVNRDGRVVYSKFNTDASTIKTNEVIRKALDVAQQYRFEKDFSAPDKQCGKLTFIFEIEAE
jgi:outer membrane biosynthesis protein TonB